MAIEKFIDYLQLERKYSVHTVLAYQKDLDQFSTYVKEVHDEDSLRQLPYAIIRSWIVSLVESGVSNRTINRKTAALKAYYKFLMQVGELEFSPLAKHKALKTAQKKSIPFSEKEMRDLLEKIHFEDDFEGVRDKLIIELLYATGIRRDELIHLKLANVSYHPFTIKVLGKRNKERIIPLISTLKPLLDSYLNLRSEINNISDASYLFLLKSGYKMYDALVYRLINHYFSIVSSKEKKSPHVLRHTFATHLLNQGADLNAVKELLGHASLSSTQVYTHNSIAELKKVHAAAHPRSKK